jgi:UDP-N-acetylmuramate dehydrogenase
MQIQSDVSLKDYSTMRVGGVAKALAIITTTAELLEAIAWATQHKLPMIMVGGGSNIIWRDEGFDGLVLVNRITGFDEVYKGREDYYVTLGAGEIWDDMVARVVTKGMHGIETLSYIPGTVGAVPIQNVGAYYQEVADTFVSLEAYDTHAKKMVTLSKDECHFGYRTSRFKTTDRGRFFLTSITLHLLRVDPTPPFYPSLQQYLDDHTIREFTPQVIRDAIIAVRSAKLPDPAVVANNGSFFANPIINQAQLNKLEAKHGSIMHWPVGAGVYKIPAAWLVEKAGLKGVHDAETGMGTWPKQALVLVNEHATTCAQVMAFKQKVQDAVREQFDILLQEEPEFLPHLT